MSMELGNICRFKHKARKALRQLIRVIRMSCWETDVEKEVKASIRCEDPNITDADTLSSVCARKSHVGLRNPERETMFFEIHVTFVDGVTGLFFDEILLFIGWRVWRLLNVSMLATLARERANLDFGRYFATTKA
jgi:hypothetical protein